MRRSLLILILALLAGVTLLGTSYLLGKCVCTYKMARNGDELEWLRREFHLNDSQMQTIRQLHQGYLPQCQERCAQIAAAKAELQAILDSNNGITPEAEQKILQVAQLRAQCQTQMLRHFQEVSKAMPPEQGRRYLAEMQRLTLGFHEQIENTMSSADSTMPHGHHHH